MKNPKRLPSLYTFLLDDAMKLSLLARLRMLIWDVMELILSPTIAFGKARIEYFHIGEELLVHEKKGDKSIQ